VNNDERQFYDSISSQHGTSCWLHAAAAATGRQQTDCCTVAAAAVDGPRQAAATGKTEPFDGQMAARCLPPTVPRDDTTTDQADVCPVAWQWTDGRRLLHVDRKTLTPGST